MLKFSIIYILISLFSILFKYKNQLFYKIFKGLPVFALIMFILFNYKLDNYGYLIIFGLTFGLIGDLLLLNKDKYFNFGLFSFLINHIFFIVFFSIHMKNFNLINFIPFIILSLSYGLYLIKNIDFKLKIPVIFYISVISTMVILCFSTNLNYFVKAGALLFLISDFILSYNKFIKKFKISEMLILSTYYSAQFLISIFSIA